jgi:hypothetical protein
LLLLVVAASASFAQNKIEKFCEVTIRLKAAFSSKRIVTISFGEQQDLFNFKDTSVIVSLQKVSALTTETDVLNYMATIGWSLVRGSQPYSTWEYLYFKKEFDKSELVSQ